MEKKNRCVFCKDIISEGGPDPLQVYYPVDRIRQKLELGFVHNICFMSAFFKFNEQMSEIGQLKNHKLLLVSLCLDKELMRRFKKGIDLMSSLDVEDQEEEDEDEDYGPDGVLCTMGWGDRC